MIVVAALPSQLPYLLESAMRDEVGSSQLVSAFGSQPSPLSRPEPAASDVTLHRRDKCETEWNELGPPNTRRYGPLWPLDGAAV